MDDLIKDDLRQLVDTWNKNGFVRGIALGHTVKAATDKDGIAVEVPNRFRQKRAYELVFRLIGRDLEAPDDGVRDFAAIEQIAREEAEELELTPDEMVAGISLAWVALKIGWERAIANHASHQYITLKREQQPAVQV